MALDALVDQGGDRLEVAFDRFADSQHAGISRDAKAVLSRAHAISWPMTPLYLKLRSTLEDLAAPATVQERKLKALGVGPDELALDLDAFGQAAANLVEQGELSAQAHALVLELLEMFDRFSGSQNAGEWTEAALHSSANWKKVRATASKALTLMQR